MQLSTPGQCRAWSAVPLRRCSAAPLPSLPAGSADFPARRERSTSAVSSAATTASHPLSSAAAVQPAAVTGLLQGVTGEHPVANRVSGVQRDPGQPVGHRVADVLEVRGAAADHRAQAGHRVVAGGQLGRHHGQLDRAGHPDHQRVVDRRTAFAAASARSHQAVGDLGVPAGAPRWPGSARPRPRVPGGRPPAPLIGPPARPVRRVGRVRRSERRRCRGTAGRPSIWWPSRSRLTVR